MSKLTPSPLVGDPARRFYDSVEMRNAREVRRIRSAKILNWGRVTQIRRLISAIVIASTLGCKGIDRGPTEISNADGVVLPHEVIRILVPGPGRSLNAEFGTVKLGEEKRVLLKDVCLPETYDGAVWVRSFESHGFRSQAVSWKGSEPIGVRFRRDRIVGDVFSSGEYRVGKNEKCRTYRLRVQYVRSFSSLRWSTTQWGGRMRSDVCIPLFSPSAIFPFEASNEYCY